MVCINNWMILRLKNTYNDKQKRSVYQNTEIFFGCCSLLDQSQFSNYLSYFLFKRRSKFSYVSKFKNKCLISGYNKSVFSRLKISRHAFLTKVSNGLTTGFYCAIW